MRETEAEYGWLSLSELVTDGYRTWWETQRYLYYSPEDARAEFAEHIKSNGWTIVGPPLQ